MKLQKILDAIVSIQFSLLKKESDIRNNKATYSKKKTAKLVITEDFPKEEKAFEQLCRAMYNDLLANAPFGADYLGVWIKYSIEGNPITIDNAMSLDALNSIEMYSKDPDIDPVYEFFKMTLPVIDEEGSLQSSSEESPVV